MRFLPILLFLVAGVWGVVVAGERGPALRELRWLVIEPLIFLGLILWHTRTDWATAQQARDGVGDGNLLPFTFYLLSSFLLGGALVGLIGVLQFLGLNLAPLIGDKVGFSDDAILVEGVRRVNSVYGHPNNLGLYMGRIWPLAAALAVGAWLDGARLRAGLLALVGLLAVGGLLVSFSRGAYLGALVAGLTLAALLLPRRLWATRRVLLPLGGLFALGIAAVVAVVALDIERFNPFGDSSSIRLMTWASALAMLRDHPLGVGLDQFGRLYPDYINPALAGTNEINTAHPHNLLLDIALRMGPLGLLAFGWLLVMIFRRGPTARDGVPGGAGGPPRDGGPGRAGGPQHAAPLRVRPFGFVRVGVVAVMAGALIHGLVDSFYFWPDLAFAFWLCFALVVWLPAE